MNNTYSRNRTPTGSSREYIGFGSEISVTPGLDRLPFSNDLAAELVAEFGPEGHRAVEFILTAQFLLSSNPTRHRLSESAAYCLREAMTEILRSGDVSDKPRRRDILEDVIRAHQGYRNAKGRGDEEQPALKTLLTSLDDLESLPEQSETYHDRLIGILINRTGSPPLSDDTALGPTYTNVLNRLNRALHTQCTRDESLELWDECIRLLNRLFLPRDERNAELDTLAGVTAPTPTQVRQLLELVVSPVHLRYFLRRLESPAWLEPLTDAGVLEPPEVGGPWLGFSAVDRLGSEFLLEVSDWLDMMYKEYGTTSVHAWYIGRAALDLGGVAALNLVLRAVRKHPQQEIVLELGLRAVQCSDPQDKRVRDLADVLLNEDSWRRLHYSAPLLDHLVNGTNAENASSRVELLCLKLRKVRHDDPAWVRIKWSLAGSVEDQKISYDPLDRFPALLNCLLTLLPKAWLHLPVSELLDHLEGLDVSLQGRLRSWILARSPGVEVSMLVGEVVRAISARYPTGDDVALLDRIDREAEAEEFDDASTRWSHALGAAPNIDHLRSALEAKEVPQDWRRVLAWLTLLPERIASDWEHAYELLAGVLPQLSHDALRERPTVRGGTVLSPISRETLLEKEPLEAARLVSKWRPTPPDPIIGCRALGETLKQCVIGDSTRWLKDPVGIATMLRHPTYISSYLQALADLSKDERFLSDEVLDLVMLVASHPWPVDAIGLIRSDYDSDWRGAEQSAVDLFRVMCISRSDLGGRGDDVWSFLENQVWDKSQPSEVLEEDESRALARALARPCTRALESALHFVFSEFNRNGVVRQEAIRLLESSLRLEGLDGLEHRAILAWLFPLLRNMLPEWMDDNKDLLFGDEAPQDLGQRTLDQTLTWGHPDAWLLENFRSEIEESVKGGVDQALYHYMGAMLGGCSGYDVAEVISFLRGCGLISQAAMSVSLLLRGEGEVSQPIEIAVEFWRKSLESESGQSVSGFLYFSQIPGLEDNVWAELTLATLAAGPKCGSREAHRVIRRATRTTPTLTVLDILDKMVREQLDHWDTRNLGRIAVYLEDSSSTASHLSDSRVFHRLWTGLDGRGAIGD